MSDYTGLINDPEALYSLESPTPDIIKQINANPELEEMYLNHLIQKLRQFTTNSYNDKACRHLLSKIQSFYLSLNIVIRTIIHQTGSLEAKKTTFPPLHETDNLISLLFHVMPYASLNRQFFDSKVRQKPSMVSKFYTKMSRLCNQVQFDFQNVFLRVVPELWQYFYQTVDFYVSAAKIKTFFLYDLEQVIFPFGGRTLFSGLASIRPLQNENDQHNEFICEALPTIPPPYLLIGSLKIILCYLFSDKSEETVSKSIDLSLGIRSLSEDDFQVSRPSNLNNLDVYYAIKLLEVGYLSEIKALALLAKDKRTHLREFVIRKGVLFDPLLVKHILQVCYVYIELYNRLLRAQKARKEHHELFSIAIDALWTIFEHCRNSTSQIVQRFFDNLIIFMGQIMIQRMSSLPDRIRYKPLKIFVLWLETPNLRTVFKNQEFSIIKHGLMFFTQNRKPITDEDFHICSVRWRFIIHHLLCCYPDTLFLLPMKKVRKYIQISIKDFFYDVHTVNSLKKKTSPISILEQRSYDISCANIETIASSFLFLAKHNITFFVGYERIVLDFIYNGLTLTSLSLSPSAISTRVAAILIMLIQNLDSIRFRTIAITDHGDALKNVLQKSITECEYPEYYLASFMNCLKTVSLDASIPPQFFDPLTLVVIENPVRLPLSSVVVDKKQIYSYLKEKQVDPFTNTPVSKEDLLIDVDSAFSIELSDFWKNLENKVIEAS